MKRYFVILFPLFLFLGGLHGASHEQTVDAVRKITVVNDIHDLYYYFPDDTVELQRSIYCEMVVNGVTLKPGEEKEILIYRGNFFLVVKSKKRLNEHLSVDDKWPRRIQAMAMSWTTVYYGFICMVSVYSDHIELATLVAEGCQLLKDGNAFRISYKPPTAIEIWLTEYLW